MQDIFSKYIKPIVGFILLGVLVWYFSDIIFYILIALILSILGSPLVRQLNKIHIGKRKMPHAISATITLLTMLLVFSLFVLIIVPLIIRQANVIASIDVDALVAHYQHPMEMLNQFLVQYDIIGAGETIAGYIESQLKSLLDLSKFTNFFTNLISATGSVFMGAFIILFLTFYFLLEEKLVKNFILSLTSKKNTERIDSILHKSKTLLVRYFQGILLEIAIMITLETAGLLIFGVPNAILIGFLGGLMNVIPYLGPVIGATIGVSLASLSELSMGNYDQVFITIVTVLAVFGVANLVDNLILQPQIYSRRVKAHPVEVFLVIIAGGQVAGIAGMILAIPTYTVVKIVAREFVK